MNLTSPSPPTKPLLLPRFLRGLQATPLHRIWRWLTLVQTNDPVQLVINRGFAYTVVVMFLFASMLTTITFTTVGPTNEGFVQLMTLPVIASAWWFNRRGTIYGAVIYVIMVVLATAFGLPPGEYAGEHPTVHVAFLYSVAIAAVFIGPRGALLACLLQISALGLALNFSTIPTAQIQVFLPTATLHIGGIAVILSMGAWILKRALRASIATNKALHELNAELEQRVADRTAELDEARRAAEHARNIAEESNYYKTRFLANMSHELRTPLNAVINFAHFLGDSEYGDLNEQQFMFQSRILYNGEHLLGLINDILDLSKIEAGKMELFREPTDLQPLFHGVMSTAVGLTKDKGLDLSIEIAEDLPLVWIDRTRIRQVLLNLLSNAAKFTDQGSITVSATRTSDGFIQIAVRDTGVGIAPEHQERIFEEFQQVQADLNRSHQGTGLGLPISKRLIEMHGGRMFIESAIGAGSTFTFTIPIAYRPQAEPDGAPRTGGLSMPIVTVIDSDVDSQTILRRILEGAGYHVQSLLDCQSALAELRHAPPALIILDLNQAPLDGWELMGQIHQDPALASIPVIVCSSVDPANHQVYVVPNVTAYLPKPIHQEHILGLVRQFAPPLKVLVVDDDPDARQLTRATLHRLGYQVIDACDGRSALDLITQAAPNLIVLDLMMPEMDGFEVLERMQEIPGAATIPVIVATAKDLEGHERVWLRERTRHCFQKPVSLSMFLSVVRNLSTGDEHGYQSR